MLSTTEEPTELHLPSVLDQVIDNLRTAYSNAVIQTDGGVPDIPVKSSDMLDSVFRNLISNAIEHNDKEIPRVSISTEYSDSTVLVKIVDNGPGIPDDCKETIFERGEKGLESSGTGLGLYLVKTLIDSHNGKVWVEDNEPDGAVFVVQLPCA